MTLEKSVWTDHDFAEMNWHDATIHALAFRPGPEAWQGSLIADIDYIVKWVPPAAGQTHFQFWLAPATLIFHDASVLQGELQIQSFPPRLDAIRRVPADRAEAAAMGYEKWVLDGQDFELALLSRGFKQVFRRVPKLSVTQTLENADRGGESFSVDDAL